MKILNLFAGIGGNRSLWGTNHEITSVERDPFIAEIYKKRFPQDKLIMTDAFEFVEKNYMNYDFIWASPPCQSHSQMAITGQNKTPIMPDARFYGLIIFLKRYFPGKFIIENVRPYYIPLMQPSAILGRHYFWSNFTIPDKKFTKKKFLLKSNTEGFKELCNFHNLSWDLIKTFNPKMWNNHDPKGSILRNCVDYRIGKYILDCASKTKQKTLF